MGSHQLRVLSYNLHKGFGLLNREFLLAQMREAIRSSQADIVFLQEVVGQNSKHKNQVKDWPTEPQFEYLADQIWHHHAYGKNAVYNEGHHGNAILSKYPFISSENLDISTHRFAQRGLLHGVIQIPNLSQKVHVLCIHMGLFEAERRAQAQKLYHRIDQLIPHDEPLLIAGDFNDWRGQISPILQKEVGVREAFEVLHGSPARSFPSWLPALRLDRIYFRKMEVVSAETLISPPWNQLSDHVALKAEFRLV
jgi:endonuclease/exonuclease/phosphatase family metal-dependent hydrolase